MSTKLYLIRHAEAEGNFHRSFHGITDSNLTENGLAQLDALAKRFEGIKIDAAFSSPLKRTMQTLSSIQSAKDKIVTIDDLIEINGGKWENMKFTDILNVYPKEYETWDKTPHLHKMPDGESVVQVFERSLSTINGIVKENKDKTIIICTHGGVIRPYMCYLLGYRLEEMHKVNWVDNTAVTIVEYDDDFNHKVEAMGDNSHLGGLSTIEKQNWWKKRKEKMIFTVTLNPCIDKTYYVDGLNINTMNRSTDSRTDCSGKGINVSVDLSVLGLTGVATGFLGGKNYGEFKNLFSQYSITDNFVLFDGKTRVNTKIIDTKTGQQTDVNDKGEYIKEDKTELLKAFLQDNIREGDLVCFSGSMPGGIDYTAFEEITDIAFNLGAQVIIDSEKNNIAHAVKRKALLIKPNIKEFNDYLNLNLSSDADIAKKAMDIVSSGVGYVIVSQGSDGLILAANGKAYKAQPLKLNVRSTTGAGDSVVAAFIYAYLDNKNPEDITKYCAAVSCATVLTKGTLPPDKEEVKKLLPQIRIEELTIL